MFIVMQGKKWEAKEYRGEVEIDVSDDTGAIKICMPNESVQLKVGEFDKQINMLELIKCLQESFETGHFYIDAIEEHIFGIEQDRNQLLIENQQLRRELESARTSYLGRG